MFKSVLIANRGEIAVRIARTLRQMGIRSVAIYSESDQHSAHVLVADHAVPLKGNTTTQTYLQADLIISIAKSENVQAIIPGYGFLSEDADFAQKCQKAGLVFIGPTPEHILQFGLKHIAYEAATRSQMPLLPHTGLVNGLEDAREKARTVGYPIMLKCTAGGGGMGILKCGNEDELAEIFVKVQRAAAKFSSDEGIYLERYVEDARHIEVQIFGDGHGFVAALGQRDCSLQRRNQKIMEETPPPNLPDATRFRLSDAAVRLGQSVNYRSAGTVEFIYDRIRDEFYFLEVNSRLQVEHTITETIYGIDLVEWMIRLAACDVPSALYELPKPTGTAIQVRICSEEPARDFQPSSGTIHEVMFPEDVRVDTWVSSGTVVSPFYDSLLAKMIVHGNTRQEAVDRLCRALKNTRLTGISSNLEFLRQITSASVFQRGEITLKTLINNIFIYRPNAIEVISPGTYTTIQDYPGRMGYWNIGVPPSGPMDDLAFRLANRLLRNAESEAALECTLEGPTLRFHRPTMIAITGANMNPTLDGMTINQWQSISVQAGQTLKLGRVTSGCRAYVAVLGGFDVPSYLDSRSTFVLGKFGGYAGRTLLSGDMLMLYDGCVGSPSIVIPSNHLPHYPNQTQHWEIAVMYGPHGAPDFFTVDYIEEFFAASWQVHYNSNRLGIRLVGPKPRWSRLTGGEAGLHPSNIHDCEYAIGSINFTGDMPIILTQDGPSLGGFVCPVTIVKAEMWKIGQLKPNDRIRFHPITFDQALALECEQDQSIARLSSCRNSLMTSSVFRPYQYECILAELSEIDGRPSIVYRQAGDHYILIEYGPMELDLRFRFRVHLLMEELRQQPIRGVLELAPGVRSLQVRYDSRIIHQRKLLNYLIDLENRLTSNDSDISLKSRIVYLPLAFEDSATLDAVARYQETVRESAPWLPNNVDFIQRINGLSSRDDVRRIVFDASYLILGLGDVYLGAPCAIPIDPRHRLMTSKYNPARTFTAEGTVGIGGVYMCIYGMDSPGGYQLIGRTLPIWNTFINNRAFKDGKPWLLRFFDQVRFYPVDENELIKQREAFRQGHLNIRIVEDNVFNLGEYDSFLTREAKSINEFAKKQAEAFSNEVSQWQQDIQSEQSPMINDQSISVDECTKKCGVGVTADICGNVWKILVNVNQIVEIDAPLIILEAMKMELIVRAPVAGRISSLVCCVGQLVEMKDVLVRIELM